MSASVSKQILDLGLPVGLAQLPGAGVRLADAIARLNAFVAVALLEPRANGPVQIAAARPAEASVDTLTQGEWVFCIVSLCTLILVGSVAWSLQPG